MVWVTVSSRSFFCWLFRASPSSAAKNIINLILVLTIWWCPHVELSLGILGKGCLFWPACCLDKTVVLCPASFCTPRPKLSVTPGVMLGCIFKIFLFFLMYAFVNINFPLRIGFAAFHSVAMYVSTYCLSQDIYFFSVFFCFIITIIIILLYNIVLVLPYINMHPPWVYMCSLSWTPLSPPSAYHPSGSSQCTSPKLPVSCIEPGLAIHFLYDIIHVLMPFSQIIPHPDSVQKTVLYICVSFAVSHAGLSLPSF